MNRKTIQLLLWPIIIILAWLVYRSPISLKEFQEEANFRKSAVIQDLKDIRTAQIAFKDKYRVYAGDFNTSLFLYFVFKLIFRFFSTFNNFF